MCTNRKDTPLFKITSSRLVLYLIIKLKVECSTQKLKSFVVFLKKNMIFRFINRILDAFKQT